MIKLMSIFQHQDQDHAALIPHAAPPPYWAAATSNLILILVYMYVLIPPWENMPLARLNGGDTPQWPQVGTSMGGGCHL